MNDSKNKQNKMKQDHSLVFTDLSEALKFDRKFEIIIFSLHPSFSDDIRAPRVIFLFLSKIQVINLFRKAEDTPPNHSPRQRIG
jgi:hypothetical protein